MGVVVKVAAQEKKAAEAMIEQILQMDLDVSRIYNGQYAYLYQEKRAASMFHKVLLFADLMQGRYKSAYCEAYRPQGDWMIVYTQEFHVILLVLKEETFARVGQRLMQRISVWTKLNMLFAAYICDERDLWYHDKLQSSQHICLPEIPSAYNEKRMIGIQRRYEVLEFLRLPVWQMDEVYYQSCWAMWFGYELCSRLPQLVNQIDCWINEKLGSGRFIMLYERRRDFALLGHRKLQREFGQYSGIDRLAEHVLSKRCQGSVMISFSYELGEIMMTVEHYYNEEGEPVIQELAEKTVVKKYSMDQYGYGREV